MGVFRVLAGALGGGNGVRMDAGRGALDFGPEIRGGDLRAPDEPVDVHAAYPSQSYSAAALDAALGRARDQARLAPG